MALAVACGGVIDETESLDSELMSGNVLQYSTRADRGAPSSLDGSTVGGVIYVFAVPWRSASRVSFYLDDPELRSAPKTVEQFLPFDFVGGAPDGSAKPLDTVVLSSGPHSITALIVFADGRRRKVTATFTVRAGTPAPTPTPDAGTPTPTPPPPPDAGTPTPTPPPPPTSGFPDATNTGVPSGTVLRRVSGDLHITQPGYVLENAEVTGCITLARGADDVIIRNVRVRSAGCYWLILNDAGAKNLTVTDTELDGMNNARGDAAFAGDNITLVRVDIHGTVDGGKVGNNVVVRDSYIHDLVVTADSHNDGLQSLGTSSLQIIHNRIVIGGGATSAIILSTGSASSMRNITIDNNLLGGGAYTVYGGYAAGADVLSRVGNINITNNKFTTQIYPRGGAFGPLTSADAPVVVSGNTWYDGPNQGKAATR